MEGLKAGGVEARKGEGETVFEEMGSELGAKDLNFGFSNPNLSSWPEIPQLLELFLFWFKLSMFVKEEEEEQENMNWVGRIRSLFGDI